MIHARARSLAALVLGVTVGCQLGCKKDGADPVTGGLPPELRPHPSALRYLPLVCVTLLACWLAGVTVMVTSIDVGVSVRSAP